MAFLKFTTGALAGHAIELTTEPLTVGRNQDADVALDDASVSARHAKIWCEVKWFVEDLDSRNLTLLNNAEVEPHQRTEIETGDRLDFGNVRAVFDGTLNLSSKMDDDALDAIQAAEEALEKMREDVQTLKVTVQVKDSALERLQREVAAKEGFVSREGLEDEIARIRAQIEGDAQKRIEAFARETREMEKRYVAVSAKLETTEKLLREREDQLNAVGDGSRRVGTR